MMDQQLDFFGVRSRPVAYPSHPGFKEGTTSREAAEKVARSLNARQEACFRAFEDGPGTADEIAARMGLSVLSVRPRVTELARDGKLRATGERRKNESGCSAKVWEAVQ